MLMGLKRKEWAYTSRGSGIYYDQAADKYKVTYSKYWTSHPASDLLDLA